MNVIVLKKTNAHRKLQDDVPEEVKHQRMIKMSELNNSISAELNRQLLGTHQLVLIEGVSLL